MDMMLFARSMGGLSAVLALLALALVVVRKFDLKLPGRVGGAQRGRIGVIERITIDSKRSLLLVQQDGREHLLLLSPEGHVVFDQGGAPAKVESFAAMIEPQEDAKQEAEPSAQAPWNDEPAFVFEPWLDMADLSKSLQPANDAGANYIRLIRRG
jgi:flagellar biogenesis protein FliO